MLTQINGLDAWRNAIGSDRWGHTPSAFEEPAYPVQHRPKFQIDPGSSFFCMGSCFARNVEEQLIYHGANVLSRRIVSPLEEWHARPNGIVNKFTTDSMLNEIRWLRDPPKPDDASLFCGTPDGWLDLQLAPGAKPVTPQRAIARRTYLTNDYFSRLRDADVLIITLGLNELWWDNASQIFLNATPPLRSVKTDPERYSLHITDVDHNVRALSTMLDLVRTIRPEIKMVLSVSPVPLGTTFSGDDPVVANSRSKSTLRSAAETVAMNDGSIDYFPSFEMVTHAPRSIAYASDCLHVNDQSVRRVIAAFFRNYIGDAKNQAPADFSELGYLAANPDVDEMVRRGELSSAFEHWKTKGRAEARPLAPITPTRLMLEAGVSTTRKRSFLRRLFSRYWPFSIVLSARKG